MDVVRGENEDGEDLNETKDESTESSEDENENVNDD